jgi:3-phosphoglycerate kinase
MANFTTIQNRINSTQRAKILLERLRLIYQDTQFARSAINDYQGNTDPVFKAAVDDAFSASERQQLGQMLTQLANLDNNWTANHLNLLKND